MLVVQMRLENGTWMGTMEVETLPRAGEWVVKNGIARTVRHVEHHVTGDEVADVAVVLKPTDADRQ